MKLKPHGTTYLIPIGILVISIIFAGFMIYRGVTQIMEIDENDWIIDLSEPVIITEETTLMVFPGIDDDELYTIIDHGNTADIRVEHSNNTFTTYPVEIFNSIDEAEGFTIDITTFDEEELDVLSITFEDPGTYYVNSELEIGAINFSELLGGGFIESIMIAVMVGGIGFVIAIAVFIIIAVRRSGSKKEYHKLRQEQIKKREQEQQSIFSE